MKSGEVIRVDVGARTASGRTGEYVTAKLLNPEAYWSGRKPAYVTADGMVGLTIPDHMIHPDDRSERKRSV